MTRLTNGVCSSTLLNCDPKCPNPFTLATGYYPSRLFSPPAPTRFFFRGNIQNYFIPARSLSPFPVLFPLSYAAGNRIGFWRWHEWLRNPSQTQTSLPFFCPPCFLSATTFHFVSPFHRGSVFPTVPSRSLPMRISPLYLHPAGNRNKGKQIILDAEGAPVDARFELIAGDPGRFID